jgi:hypothetical protein
VANGDGATFCFMLVWCFLVCGLESLVAPVGASETSGALLFFRRRENIELNPQDRKQLAELASVEIARRSLADFARHTIPNYQTPPHIEQIAGLLEKVERGEIRRLLVTLMPGSGKSTLLQAFVSWYLGRNPSKRIITTSASAELAERNSRASRDLFENPRWPFDARLSRTTFAQHRWDVEKHRGGLFASSVGAMITGWRAPLIIGDDLQNCELTTAEMDNLWKWWREVLMPRLEPNGA